MAKKIVAVCSVCGRSLIFDQDNQFILFNDNMPHKYALVCSNSLCGVKCIRTLSQAEASEIYP